VKPKERILLRTSVIMRLQVIRHEMRKVMSAID
jgi:hypothetical protein